jgi:RNA polymerase sigma-70 factor (ECF subfamily)
MIAHSHANCLHEPVRLRDDSIQTPTGKMSDGALIGAIADRDQQAMRRLYERHNLRVYRFARRLGAVHSTAEDLVSEVFLEVWLCAGAFEGRAQVSTWLLAITRNKAMGIIRQRPLNWLDESELASIKDETDGPEAAIQKRQAASILSEALRHLSPAHREIIDLVYYHEKSIEEVARIIKAPRSTVKTRMFYARKRLSTLLAQRGQDAPKLLA